MTIGSRGPAGAAGVMLAAFALAGCPAPAQVAPAPCAPVQARLAASPRPATAAGEYRLTLVATSGPRAGHAVTGRLTLRPHGEVTEGASGVSYPLRGTAEVALDSVGAAAPGSIASTDPGRPGVLGVVSRSHDAATSRTDLTLRFGADANGPDTGKIEGVHTALFVDSLSSSALYGRWNSGTPDQRSAGHFCAVRVR